MAGHFVCEGGRVKGQHRTEAEDKNIGDLNSWEEHMLRDPLICRKNTGENAPRFGYDGNV